MQKVVQKRLYSFLNSRWGIVFVLLGVFTFINALLSFVGAYDPFSDNLVDTSYQQRIIPLPIDIVYTWVNGSDPEQLKALHLAKQQYLNISNDGGDGGDGGGHDDDTSKLSRFVDNEELRFSLRSVEKQAPWVRHIYIVTNGQVPHWLNTGHPRITVVTHQQIFDAAHLPTFSSPAIEANLHKIDDVSEWFLYLNDDTMFGGPVWPSDFITPAEGQKVFLSWAVPPCNEGCPSNWIGDGYCDIACNNTQCDWDAGDCANITDTSDGSGAGAGGNFWGGESMRYCARGCPNSWIGDKYCDRACRVVECGYDGGDCGFDLIREGMLGFEVLPSQKDPFVVPWDTPSVYFNLSSISGPDMLVDGSHSESSDVRIATVSQKFKVMIITFNQNITDTVKVDITWDTGKNFTFRVQPTIRADNETQAPHSEESASRHLMSLSSSQEEVDGVPSHHRFVPKAAVHPMGVGERVGTDVFPWQRLPPPRPNRHLFDIYGESLKHVNSLFNSRFSNDARKVPAHMPHFIQKSVLQRLHAAFPEEFAKTSASRFRSPTDMQFAFSYFYFLINERAERYTSFEELFNKHIDVDGDGVASTLELRKQWVLLYEPPVEPDQFAALVTTLRDGRPQEPITAASFDRALPEKQALLDYYASKPRQKHEVRDTDDVAFIMVSNNDTKLEARLDGIIRRGQKFICLNDNLDHDHPDTPRLKKMMADFYSTLYPNPSAFELVQGEQVRGGRWLTTNILWYVFVLFLVIVVALYLVRAVRGSKSRSRRALEARSKRF